LDEWLDPLEGLQEDVCSAVCCVALGMHVCKRMCDSNNCGLTWLTVHEELLNHLICFQLWLGVVSCVSSQGLCLVGV
jgi:hypothetical protein